MDISKIKRITRGIIAKNDFTKDDEKVVDIFNKKTNNNFKPEELHNWVKDETSKENSKFDNAVKKFFEDNSSKDIFTSARERGGGFVRFLFLMTLDEKLISGPESILHT